MPKTIVFRDELPKSNVGKILRKDLRSRRGDCRRITPGLMDNLCHTLAGAALGEAGLKRQTRLGMATLMIASNLPDIDVAVFATDTLAMSFRRGWTHGVLAMAVLPAVLAGVMFALGRRRSAGRSRTAPGCNFEGLLLLAYIGDAGCTSSWTGSTATACVC